MKQCNEVLTWVLTANLAPIVVENLCTILVGLFCVWKAGVVVQNSMDKRRKKREITSDQYRKAYLDLKEMVRKNLTDENFYQEINFAKTKEQDYLHTSEHLINMLSAMNLLSSLFAALCKDQDLKLFLMWTGLNVLVAFMIMLITTITIVYGDRGIKIKIAMLESLATDYEHKIFQLEKDVQIDEGWNLDAWVNDCFTTKKKNDK